MLANTDCMRQLRFFMVALLCFVFGLVWLACFVLFLFLFCLFVCLFLFGWFACFAMGFCLVGWLVGLLVSLYFHSNLLISWKQQQECRTLGQNKSYFTKYKWNRIECNATEIGPFYKGNQQIQCLISTTCWNWKGRHQSTLFQNSPLFTSCCLSQSFVRYCLSAIVCLLLLVRYCLSGIVCLLLFVRYRLSAIVCPLMFVRYCLSAVVCLLLFVCCCWLQFINISAYANVFEEISMFGNHVDKV